MPGSVLGARTAEMDEAKSLPSKDPRVQQGHQTQVTREQYDKDRRMTE